MSRARQICLVTLLALAILRTLFAPSYNRIYTDRRRSTIADWKRAFAIGPSISCGRDQRSLCTCTVKITYQAHCSHRSRRTCIFCTAEVRHPPGLVREDLERARGLFSPPHSVLCSRRFEYQYEGVAANIRAYLSPSLATLSRREVDPSRLLPVVAFFVRVQSGVFSLRARARASDFFPPKRCSDCCSCYCYCPPLN